MILCCAAQCGSESWSVVISVVSIVVSIVALLTSYHMARIEHKIALSSQRLVARTVMLVLSDSLAKAWKKVSVLGEPSVKEVADEWFDFVRKNYTLMQFLKGIADTTSSYGCFDSSRHWLENELNQVEFFFKDKSIGSVAKALAELLKECADEYSRFKRDVMTETKFDPKAENLEIVVSNIASLEEKLDKEMRLY